MSKVALLLALAALACAGLPDAAPFVGVALSGTAIAAGVLGFRRRGDTGGKRLACAAWATVGGLALALCGTRIALILLAVSRLTPG